MKVLAARLHLVTYLVLAGSALAGSALAAGDELHQDILKRAPVAFSLSNFDAAIDDAWSDAPLQTSDGRELRAQDWAAKLGIDHTPSLVFFDDAGREVFRTQA